MGLGSICCLLMMGFAAAGIVSAAPLPAQSKQLDVVPSADLPNIDPVFASVVITRIFGMMVYEELFAWDNNLQPRPEMVQNWSTSPDELIWQFTLRDGLKFHDGAPVTSADVIASLKRWAARDPLGKMLMADTATLDARDARTFAFVLKQPFPMILDVLGKP